MKVAGRQWWGRAGRRLSWFGPLVTVAGKGGWLCDAGGDDGGGVAVGEKKRERKRGEERGSRRRWLAVTVAAGSTHQRRLSKTATPAFGAPKPRRTHLMTRRAPPSDEGPRRIDMMPRG
ncbi:hypothetical protein Droror1_Dr00002600 [Drosera rotundifolia]